MTNMLRVGCLFAVLAVTGCKNKGDAGGEKKSGVAPSATPGLKWTPIGYDKLSTQCKRALACCEDMATADGAKSADDYNLKCSGPALWKDEECDMDVKSRISVLESGGKAVPPACK